MQNLRCVSGACPLFCGDAFDRRRSTSVDGARGELGSCLSRGVRPLRETVDKPKQKHGLVRLALDDKKAELRILR
jgi:hypothetical protein